MTKIQMSKIVMRRSQTEMTLNQRFSALSKPQEQTVTVNLGGNHQTGRQVNRNLAQRMSNVRTFNHPKQQQQRGGFKSWNQNQAVRSRLSGQAHMSGQAGGGLPVHMRLQRGGRGYRGGVSRGGRGSGRVQKSQKVVYNKRAQFNANPGYMNSSEGYSQNRGRGRGRGGRGQRTFVFNRQGRNRSGNSRLPVVKNELDAELDTYMAESQM